MTARLRCPAALAAALVAVMALTTGCGSSTPSPSPPRASTTPEPSQTSQDPGIPQVSAVMPLPADANVASNNVNEVLPAAPPDDSCNPLASLQPTQDPPEKLVPKIKARGRLIVGLDQGSNLFSFRDPISGQLTGFDVDLAYQITKDIFGNPDQVEFQSLTSANRITALQTQQVDVVIKSMSINCERRKSVTFSAPYFQSYQRVLAVRGSGIRKMKDLEGKRVCVAAGTTSASRLWSEISHITVLSVNTWADCLVAIQQDQVDAITTDDAILVGITSQDPYLEIVGPQAATEPYGVGIARSTPGNNTDGLVRQVNKTLARIRSDGTWNRMYMRWLSALGESPGMPGPSYVPEER